MGAHSVIGGKAGEDMGGDRNNRKMGLTAQCRSTAYTFMR